MTMIHDHASRPRIRATTTHALPRKVSRRSKRSEIDCMQASTNTHARIVGDHLDAASILEDFFVRLCHSPVPLSVGDPPMAPSSCYWTTTEHGGPLVALRQLHLTPPKPLLSPSLQRSGTP